MSPPEVYVKEDRPGEFVAWERHPVPGGVDMPLVCRPSKQGALKAALTMSQPPPREKALDKVTRRARESPHTIFRVILAVVLMGLVAGVWAWQAREPELVAYGKCTGCGSLTALPWTATEWPARCGSCGRRTVGFAVICPNGHVFARSSPFSREPCPQCGADYGRPLTEEEFLRLTRRRLR